MVWEPDEASPAPATTPATAPPAFDRLQVAQEAYAAAEAREREQLENQLEAIEDETRREMTGWISDLLPWVGGGLALGLGIGFFTRRKS